MIRYFMPLLLICLLFSACNTVRDEPYIPADELPDAQGFYTAVTGEYTLKYKVVNANTLHCVLSAPGTGWLAVGFDPSEGMRNANFVIGHANGNTGDARDDWGTSYTAHLSDLELGGSSDLTLLNASEISGVTRLEFQIPLNSGDAYDRVLSVGNTYPVILARGYEDDFETFHRDYAATSIRLRP